VYLKDIWPTTKEINAFMKKYVTATIFKKKYADVFKGDTNWRKIKTTDSETYRWNMARPMCRTRPTSTA
jgi:aconitate hydratase